MYHERRRSSIDSLGSLTLLHLHPTDSVGSMRPSLAWLFNRIRREDEKNLTKSDLSRLLGSQVDSSQLDQAFENLDIDGDGKISMEEFITGVARFWKEAPHTPSAGSEQKIFCLSALNSLSPAHPSLDRGRGLGGEEYYEYEGLEESTDRTKPCPSTHFQSMLSALSAHNRHSMEHLWVSLQDANPELLGDFEDFVSEVVSEVEGAQRALDKQRRANKREAVELDDEIESRLNAAQTTLHAQTHLVRQEEKAKLEKGLVAKECELLSIRLQLQELESEIMQTQHSRYELEQQCEDLSKEKEDLKERLEVSERMLQEKNRSTQLISMEELNLQQQKQNHQEEELLLQKKAYEEHIDALRKQLDLHCNRSEEEEELVEIGRLAQPDLVATTRQYQNRSLASSPFLPRGVRCKRSRTVIKKNRPHLAPSPLVVESGLQRSPGLSLSLPNLTDLDNLESGLEPVASNFKTTLDEHDCVAAYKDHPLRPGSSSSEIVSSSPTQPDSDDEEEELQKEVG